MTIVIRMYYTFREASRSAHPDRLQSLALSETKSSFSRSSRRPQESRLPAWAPSRGSSCAARSFCLEKGRPDVELRLTSRGCRELRRGNNAPILFELRKA